MNFRVNLNKAISLFQRHPGIVISATFAHMCYAYGTISNELIEVKDKYTFDGNGCTRFMVVDTNNIHRRVVYSLWYWQWEAPENWNDLKIGQRYSVKTYGYRIGLLSMFPNIVQHGPFMSPI